MNERKSYVAPVPIPAFRITPASKITSAAFLTLALFFFAGWTTSESRSAASPSDVRGRSVLIVTTNADTLPTGKCTGLWLEEFAVPFNTLTEAGVAVTVASPKGGTGPLDPKTKANARERQKFAGALRAVSKAKRLSEVSAERFDAIFLPGGHGPMMDLTNNPKLKRLIESFDRAGKPIAAVCHGPVASLNAWNAAGGPLLQGRKVTGFTNIEERLAMLHDDVPYLLEDAMKKCGADFGSGLPMTSHVVRDGNLITGQNPTSTQKIADELLRALR